MTAKEGVGFTLDIRDETQALCRKLGLNPEYVYQLTLTQKEVAASVYKWDDQLGAKQVDPATGLPATVTIRYEVDA